MKKLKYQTILKDLMVAMRDGKFGDGAKLPSERALAQKYSVTRSTARRALIHLTEMRLVERDGPHGTRVKPGRVGDQAVTVSLVCPEGMNSLVEEFIRSGIRETERRQWGHRIIRVETNDEGSFIYPLSLGNPCLLLGEPVDFRPSSKLEVLLQKAEGRCAVVGTRMDYAGIPSVICDDMKGITLAINRFLVAGHSKVAFILGPDPFDHPTTSVQLHTWRRSLTSSMTETELNDGLIRVDTTAPFTCTEMAAYEAVRVFLASPKSKGFTALLCQTEEYANGAAAACRDVGKPIPEKMSLIQMGTSNRAVIAFPPRDVVDIHVDQHVQFAIEMIEQALEKKLDLSHSLRIVNPTLIEGQSVSKI